MGNKELSILEQINDSSLLILTCAKSLEYIEKDLDEMEMRANRSSEGSFMGLTNIVEQMVAVIVKETEKIMVLSESV